MNTKSTPTIFGIQGGPGSFNQEALQQYTKNHHTTDYQTKYLYTTEKVLTALDQNQIDYGLFAIHNSLGGLVQETLQSISKHTFTIVEEFAIPITHHLIKLPQTPKDKITTIMAHPQVLKQCQQTLAQNYPHLQQTSGSGDLIDTATAAKALTENKLPHSTAILGSQTIAPLYQLEIIDSNLQDNPHNLTSFLMVKK